MESTPCRVKGCPAIGLKNSQYGYCAIHETVASDAELFEQALKGRCGLPLKDFAEQAANRVYPIKFNWHKVS